MSKKNREETALVNSCLKLSLYYPDLFLWRNNTGATKINDSRFIRFGKTGSADIIGILKPGIFFAVECKIGKAKLRDSQKHFMNNIATLGGIYVVIRSVEDFRTFIDLIIKKTKGMNLLNEGINDDRDFL